MGWEDAHGRVSWPSPILSSNRDRFRKVPGFCSCELRECVGHSGGHNSLCKAVSPSGGEEEGCHQWSGKLASEWLLPWALALTHLGAWIAPYENLIFSFRYLKKLMLFKNRRCSKDRQYSLCICAEHDILTTWSTLYGESFRIHSCWHICLRSCLLTK